MSKWILLLVLAALGWGAYHYFSGGYDPDRGKPPVVRLSKFVDEHINRVLGPLDRGSFATDAHTLRQLREDLLDRSIKASADKRQTYLSAVKLCDTLLQALNERETYITRINNVDSTVAPSSLARYPHKEVVQRRALYVNSAHAFWTEKSRFYQNQVTHQYAVLREAERNMP